VAGAEEESQDVYRSQEEVAVSASEIRLSQSKEEELLAPLGAAVVLAGAAVALP